MRRVVITGVGVVAPNGNNVDEFLQSISNGVSGIKFCQELEDLNFKCQVVGLPDQISSESELKLSEHISKGAYNGLKNQGIKYSLLASIAAYKDAGLSISKEETDWITGCVYGYAVGDLSVSKDVIQQVDNGQPRKLGARYVPQTMNSGASAFLTQVFGFGNHVFTNASACCTGTESILLAYQKIKTGVADRMLTGSSEAASKYTWGGFDAMRVLSSRYNDQPTKASRPMSASAAGFVPGAGAATFILEELETAKARGAKIYAEILGGAINCGGQRGKGSMTAPNNIGVQRCIKSALESAAVSASEIDLISGHLTATYADKIEVNNWLTALNLSKENFPYINAPKSMIGHCIGAAGSIECLAAVLQLHHGFIHPTINCEDLHPEIEALISSESIPRQKIEKDLNVVIKANFGFGDVNACIVFKKYS